MRRRRDPNSARSPRRIRLRDAASLVHQAVACLMAALAVSGCGSHIVRVVDMTPPQQAETIENQLLDVGVAVLDANVPDVFDDQVAQNVTEEVRRAEANYIAYFTKELLQSTGNWGAVRVVPRQTHAVDLTVGGTIVHSDGERLIVRMRVMDARGVVWLDTTYEALASKYAYDDSVPADIDPFQSIYRRLADDMLAYRNTLTEDDVRAIRATAELKFARDLATDAFADYVAETAPGVFEVRRLPAQGDPMLARVRNVREREYLFIDTLDEYFDDFRNRMYPTYQNWRRATYSEAIAYRQQRDKARRHAIAGAVGIAAGIVAQTSDSRVTRYGGAVSIIGGALVVKNSIQKYADAKVHSQVLRELGTSAEAEISPHTIELENRTISLQGTVAKQFEQLRAVLKELYYEDLGVAPPSEEALADTALDTHP